MKDTPITLKPIGPANIEAICLLAGECFIDDPFYLSIHPDRNVRIKELQSLFARSIQICMQYGHACCYEENGQPVAFALWFDYGLLKKTDSTAFNHIFPTQAGTPLQRKIHNEQQSIDRLLGNNTNFLYLLAIGVRADHRRKGIARSLVAAVQAAFPQYNLFADLSNRPSATLYQQLGFEIADEKEDCIFMRYTSPQPNADLTASDTVYLAIPPSLHPSRFLEREVQAERILLPYIRIQEGEAPCFIQSLYETSEASLIPISYNELLRYQRYINLADCQEIHLQKDGHTLTFYVSTNGKSCFQDTDEATGRLLASKQQEWSLIPDICISIPIQYNDVRKLEQAHAMHNDFTVNQMLCALDFRTHYEAGIPIKELDNRNFKERIIRYYAGNVTVQIQSEEEISFSGPQTGIQSYIGAPVEMEMIVSIDSMTQTGVLHLISMSCGLVLTQLLDSVSRNQLNIQCSDGLENLYQYLKRELDIEKRGTAKSFITLPQNRNTIADDLLASILFCETHYAENESLGTIADNVIVEKLKSEHGIAQYNYACVYAHTNVVIQMSDTLAGSITERITRESITLFYIELILFEEAAIQIANHRIVNFLTQLDNYVPSSVLKQINAIVSDHVRTIEFWDIQMNYPSSKKSVDDIREAFHIRKELELIERNKAQLLTIYQTRSDIIDRKEAAILSAAGIVLAGVSSVEAVNNCGDSPIFYIVTFLVIILLWVKRFFLRKEIKSRKKK